MAGTIKHQWNGTVLTITSDSGTSSCDLKGAKGDDGPRGPQGAPGSTIVEDCQKLGGVAAENYALKTDTVENANKLGNVAAESYALKTDTVENANKLGNVAAANYALKTDTIENANKLGNVAAAQYALKTDTIENANKLGNVAAGSYALKTDVAPDSTMLGGKAPAYYLQPRNLLDNSDFTNPVNQRGATAYNTNNAYAIDRWIIENGTCWVVENFVSVSAGGYLVQRVPAYVMAETKTYTLATMDVSGSVKVAEAAGMVLFDDGTHGYHTVKILPGEYIWAALYEGSYTADTLPPYVPKGYAAELAEC